jgi:hypothetical protein
MADRNFVVPPAPGLLDGWWMAPLAARSDQPGLVRPGDAAQLPSSNPGLLDSDNYWSRAASEPRQQSLPNASVNDQSSLPPDTAGLWGAAQHWVENGSRLRAQARPVLLANPIVDMVWQPSISGRTGRGGFSPDLLAEQHAKNIKTGRLLPTPPPPDVPAGAHPVTRNRANGLAAEQAIANYYRALGLDVGRNVPQQEGARYFDIVVKRPAADQAFNSERIIESKLGEADLKGRIPGQLEFDANYLRQNRAIRLEPEKAYRAGSALHTMGRIVRPAGVVLDAMELGSAYQADGNRIGENTKRTASGIAGGALGGWGGAAAGAALGIPLGPLGMAAGAIGGGLFFGAGGDLAARWLYDNYDHRLSANEIPPSLNAPMP